jgi:hypothetical protein
MAGTSHCGSAELWKLIVEKRISEPDVDLDARQNAAPHDRAIDT